MVSLCNFVLFFRVVGVNFMFSNVLLDSSVLLSLLIDFSIVVGFCVFWFSMGDKLLFVSCFLVKWLFGVVLIIDFNGMWVEMVYDFGVK